MAIINLRSRITHSFNEYEYNKKSAKSLIYVDNHYSLDSSSPEVLILTVGDSYYTNSQQIKISKKGIVIKPGESRVIETKQK